MQELQPYLLACGLALDPVLLPSGGQVCVKIAVPQAVDLLHSGKSMEGLFLRKEALAGQTLWWQ